MIKLLSKILIKSFSMIMVFALIIPLVPVIQASAEENEISKTAETEQQFIATPFTKENGELAQGLESAVAGKKHWLESTEDMPVTVTENAQDGTLVIANGIIERTFKIPETGSTEFYTKSYKNTYINKELLKDEAVPDAIIGLYDKPYDEVYNDDDVKTLDECFNDGVIKYDPDYYYIGGTNEENTFVFDGYEVSDTCEKPFDWTPRSKTYSDPAADEWPPKGKHIEFNFSAPSTAPTSYHGVKVKVIYEMYDKLAAMKKRVEVTNENDNLIMVGRMATEVLNGNENLDELFYKESSYTCGDDATIPISTPLSCTCGREKTTSPFYKIKDLEHACYELGPAYELEKDQTFASFDIYELIHSTYWFELKMRERLGMYRTLFPWITDNPVTFHAARALSKDVIDHAAAAGIEMIIQSFGNWDTSNHMLSRDPSVLNHYKELIDYAHSKNVDIGIYQAMYNRTQYGGQGSGSAEYGMNEVGKWKIWCQASAAFDDYWDNFKYFVKYTGVDCVEIDGPYPGTYCNNGHKHINADKETDPDPDGTDKTVGTESKYVMHNGFFDSRVKQWENSVRFLCKELRNMDTYIKVPGWYYLNGGNKCGIGYEERAFNASRQEQLLYTRQIMHNASYARTMSMSWSHIPFIVYQGEYDGPGTAIFSPFKDKMDDYNWVLAQNLGNGITTDFRGTEFYDDETKGICDKWVNFFKRYRGIVNADLVHMTQAAYEDENKDRTRCYKFDTLFHADANNDGEKGLLWVYNQTDEPRTETITVPMYYTGLTKLEYPPVPQKGSLGTKNIHLYYKWKPNYSWLPDKEANYKMPDTTGEITGTASFLREGVEVNNVKIDSNGNAQIEVTLPAMSFTYYTIYDTSETPDVKINIGKVKNVKATSTSADTAEITWDKDVDITVTENGNESDNSAVTVDKFNVYRNGTLIGTSISNSFTDSSLEENTTYTYEVRAVAAGNEGESGGTVSVTTGADTIKPTVTAVSAETTNEIKIKFSEKVDKTTAETVSDYAISNDINVISATLSEDEKTVLLKTDTLSELVTYTVTISGIKDKSVAGNVIDEVTKNVIYGYIAYYDMNNVENDILKDKYGINDGTVKNVTAKEVDGRKALIFNSSNNSYAALGTGIFNSYDNSSVNIWIKPDSITDKQVVLSQGQDGYADYSVYIENGKLKFRVCDDENDTNLAEIDGGSISADKWSMVTLTVSGDTFKLYVDGKQAGQAKYNGNKTRETIFYIGAMQNNAGGDRTLYYSGAVSETSLYKITLSDSAVEDIYESQSTEYKEFIDRVKYIDGSYYTGESYKTFKDAVSKLENLLGSSATSEKIKAAYKEASDAEKALELKEKYNGLISVFNMDEESGETVVNGISGNNGILKNGNYLRYATPFGNGIYMTTVLKNNVTVNSSPLKNVQDFAVSGWFKSQTKLSSEITTAGKQILFTDGAITLYLKDEKLTLDVNGTEITSNSKIKYETVTSGEERQAWNNFTIVRKDDEFILYLNGAEENKATVSNVALGDKMIIGSDSADGNYFNGLINCFKFYGKALTDDEVKNIQDEIPFVKSKRTNIALNKAFMGDKNSLDNPEYINDGYVLKKASSDTPWTARGKNGVTVPSNGLKFGFDLGKEYTIGAWSLTPFYRNYNHAQLRRYDDIVIQVSTTADFSSGVTTIFNTDTDNSMGYGKGTDNTFYSFELGYDKILDKPVKGRYVRLISRGFYDQVGSSYNNTANMGELEIYEAENMYFNVELNADNNADVYVMNNTGADISGNIYVAVYDENGVLKGVKKEEISINNGSEFKNTYGVSAQSGDTVKAMLWDSEMKPVSEVAEVTAQ